MPWIRQSSPPPLPPQNKIKLAKEPFPQWDASTSPSLNTACCYKQKSGDYFCFRCFQFTYSSFWKHHMEIRWVQYSERVIGQCSSRLLQCFTFASVHFRAEGQRSGGDWREGAEETWNTRKPQGTSNQREQCKLSHEILSQSYKMFFFFILKLYKIKFFYIPITNQKPKQMYCKNIH